MAAYLQVRQIVMDVVGQRIKAVGDSDNLFDAGLSSHDAMAVMIAIEEAFGIEFPDHLLHRETFACIQSIVGALGEIGVANVPLKPG
jgi:acyl carrier protein